ncbi:ARM repeat superfamily protein [Euphorbia peplus]|nr:ARM repeat superfamily protein [Euphorbia peplus]
MDKISAACAMDWSMELDKSLRSKKPGQAVKAIQQIGERLQLLSRQPKPTMAVYNMYGLVPGEDRLFTNTILLRLADAFRLGDNNTRRCVVRVFLSEFKNRDKVKKGKEYAGILSKSRVQNPMELLKRVKFVFDTGDVESRGLALVLFGCWAHFAKDSVHIRYLILSHLVSSEILEVKASLFSAGCYCELAVDFASVVLDMLLNIVISPDSPLAIRLAGARVFAKMGCSYSIANRAYQIGLKLLIDSSDEDFSVAMLLALSKLAAKSTLLLSKQFNLLLLFLNKEKTLRLQGTAIRIVDETELPSAMQCEALQILQRLLVLRLSELDCEKVSEFTHLLMVVEKAAQSHVLSKSLLAIRILIDVPIKIKGRADIELEGYSISSLPRIFSILLNQITSLVKPGLDCNNNSEVQDFQSLLNHLLFLVGECPDLGVPMLEETRSFIEHVVDLHDRILVMRDAEESTDEVVDFTRQKGRNIILNLVNNVQKFAVTCIENLNEVGSMTNEILDKVKLLVESVHRCRLFESHVDLKYSILLHSRIIRGSVLNKNEESSGECGNLSTSICQELVEYGILSLELADKMLRKRDYWLAYKAGIFAVYHGAWATASFIFGQLLGKVQSDSFSCWLKALAKIADSEVKIQFFLIPKLWSSLVALLQKREFRITCFEDNLDEIGQGAPRDISGPNQYGVLIGACYGLRSSGETLKSIPVLGNSYCFQRWFLALRARLLTTVVDALKVLGSVHGVQENISNGEHADKSITVKSLDSLRRISEMSIQFKSMANEFDLIAMSFIGMDTRSSKIISALALSCSLLAFTTAFARLDSNSLESSETIICVENLVERLCCVDQETCSNVRFLLKAGTHSKCCCHLQSRNQILNSGCEIRDILDICRHAVSAVVALQNEAKAVHDEAILSRIANDGLQLVLKTVSKWMLIPFRIPKYFFRMRPSILSELFAYSVDAQNPSELIVSRGFYLSINLGLQLHNLPPDLKVQIKKLYCIVCSSTSFREPKSHREKDIDRDRVPLDFEAPDISKIAMNKKLFHHVTEEASNHSTSNHNNHSCNKSDDGIVCGFARFDLNDRGQGFSNCLLNVSNFPAGCYRIRWHSCCVDNEGCYWSLISQNAGPIFTVQDSPMKIVAL